MFQCHDCKFYPNFRAAAEIPRRRPPGGSPYTGKGLQPPRAAAEEKHSRLAFPPDLDPFSSCRHQSLSAAARRLTPAKIHVNTSLWLHDVCSIAHGVDFPIWSMNLDLIIIGVKICTTSMLIITWKSHYCYVTGGPTCFDRLKLWAVAGSRCGASGCYCWDSFQSQCLIKERTFWFRQKSTGHN